MRPNGSYDQPVAPVAKISDVARAAGVSPATVLRVLNRTGTVSSARSARVLRAAAELGYQPNGPARALRRRKTRLWAVIIADIENPFFTAMVRGIEDVARDEDHRIVLCNSDEDPAKEAAYIEVAIAEQVAGVIIAVTSASSSSLDAILDRHIPVVAIDRRPHRYEARVDSVLVDNRLGAAQATSHLIAEGAKRIACITGPARASTAADRLAGYKDALTNHKRRYEASLVRRSDFRLEGGYEATRELLRSNQPPDAIFVANNLMTLGALEAIAEAGLRVPHDIAVVGFDEAPWATLTTPPLTVVAQPTRQIGQEAARLLSTAGLGVPARHIVLPPQLVVRGSSRRS